MATLFPLSGRAGSRQRLLAAAAGALTLVATLTMTTTQAHASTARNGVCESGEFCLYYNSDEQGSVSDFSGSVSDYGATEPSCYDFKGAGNGKGQCVKNNAASVWNRTSGTVTVFYNSGYAGASESFASGAKANLNSTLKNENAGHRFGGGGGGGGGTVTGPTAAARAKVWADDKIPYSQSTTFQGYRTDCSGYVSMAWGLAKPGPNTAAMPGYGSYITKADLKEGDALLYVNSGGGDGHIVLFVKWADSGHTKYYGYEETPSYGAHYQLIPYPYFSGYGTFKPFRYRGLA